jgi:aryl-alcohol dehydrogenase-like predicted oxidoreductase
MRHRRVGRSGLVVSVVGLGCNNFGRGLDTASARKVVDAALDEGITLFDAADIYGSQKGSCESMLGEIFAGRRDSVILATKFGFDMDGENGPDWGARGSRRYIRRAVEGSLRRLRTDYIDLYQYHRPDGVTPLEETLSALDELVKEGKVRYVGSSNLAAWEVVECDWLSRREGVARFVSAQKEYSLLERGAEAEFVPACLHCGVGFLPYFPLASGRLTGKYRRGDGASPDHRLSGEAPQWTIGSTARPWNELLSDEVFDRIEALEAYAAERDISLLEVAVGGLLARPGVTSVIAGATSAEQVRANAAAAEWIPSAADLVAIDAVPGALR